MPSNANAGENRLLQGKALCKDTIEFVKRMPKAELHLHFEGTFTPKLMITLAKRNKLSLPFTTEEDFQVLYQFSNFDQFSQSFLFGVSLLREPEDFYYAMVSLGEMLNEDNIRYAEVTWTPQLYLNRSCGLSEIFNSLNKARAEVFRAHGIRISWIPDLVRSRPEAALLAARWLLSLDAKAHGIVAIGLGGPELGHPAAQFVKIFAEFARLGIPSNPHAGETAGPPSVMEALSVLNPRRIGHGVRSVEDEELMLRLMSQQTPLEICISSNLKLGVFKSYSSHPLPKLMQAGCLVTLNTDDPVLFQTSLSREYLIALSYLGLTIRDIRNLNMNAIHCSYLDAITKAEYLKVFAESFSEFHV